MKIGNLFFITVFIFIIADIFIIEPNLTILKNAKMITSTRQGQNIIYSLNTTVFHDVVKWIYSIRKEENEDEKD